MCLTIPAKIISLNKNKAAVLNGGIVKEVNVFLTPGLKIGDWILYVSDFALRKISGKDAKEIIELLEDSRKKINISNLSVKFKNIIAASSVRQLGRAEIVYLLNTKGQEKEALFSEANIARKSYLSDFICIHGIIEFSNFCGQDCLYCGLRNQNRKIKRYRMPVREIVQKAKEAVEKKGYKILVLQSGEDYFYTDEMLAEIIGAIKKSCRVFIFMSVGERSRDCYKKMKQAGASGVLFRFETANQKLFKKLHPRGKNFKNRFESLKFMKELGYFIATGSLIGLPGQTTKDLADDILTAQKWANMVSMGPFIPAKNTPLEKRSQTSNSKKTELNLKMIATLRLLRKDIRIPVVTALETLAGASGRKRALQSGANALMLNLTPNKYRQLYKIYDNKFYQKENIWENYGLFKRQGSYAMLEERMKKELTRN